MRQTNAVGDALHLVSGLTLGRYELVLRVARGGMGEVWAARLRREHGFQKLFALKVLRPELSRDPGFQRMFVDEAALAARIRHPNVVSVVDLGEREGRLFFVMEWVSGEPLSSILRSARGCPAPPLVAARIVHQICAGLDAAHELCDDYGRPLGLVHCDVSPDNILITSEGLVRLVDFGVAMYEGTPLSEQPLLNLPGAGGAGAPAAASDFNGRSWRARQELRGKAPYMAPEHILGGPSDRRADVFAAGVLLYELLVGAHPFLAEDDRITMCRIASDSPAEPPSSRLRSKKPCPSWSDSTAGEAMPPALDSLVSAAIAKSPAERTPTAAELMRGLEEAVPGAALQSSDALVALWIAGVLGESRELRACKLREALEAVERGFSEREQAAPPPPAPEPAPAQSARAPASRRWSPVKTLRGARSAVAAALAVAGCALAGLGGRSDSPTRALDDDPPPSSDARGLARCGGTPPAPVPPAGERAAAAPSACIPWNGRSALDAAPSAAGALRPIDSAPDTP